MAVSINKTTLHPPKERIIVYLVTAVLKNNDPYKAFVLYKGHSYAEAEKVFWECYARPNTAYDFIDTTFKIINTDTGQLIKSISYN